MGKLQIKMTKPVHWNAQVGKFNTNYTSKVEIVMTKLDATKFLTWNLYLSDLKVKHRYDMILVCDILYKLKIYLLFSNNTIRVNRGAYKGYVALMDDVLRINFNA